VGHINFKWGGRGKNNRGTKMFVIRGPICPRVGDSMGGSNGYKVVGCASNTGTRKGGFRNEKGRISKS